MDNMTKKKKTNLLKQWFPNFFGSLHNSIVVVQVRLLTSVANNSNKLSFLHLCVTHGFILLIINYLIHNEILMRWKKTDGSFISFPPRNI